MKYRPTQSVAPVAAPVTLEEAKEFTWVTHSSHDTLITSLLAAAVEHLDGYSGLLGRCIINQTWIQKYSTWDDPLRLPFPDVSSVTLKYYDTDNVLQTVSSSNYELLEDDIGSYIKFLDSYTFPSLYDDRSDAVSVTMVAGFGAAATSVPNRIKTAIKMLVAHIYANREVVSAEDLKEIPLHVGSLIAPYRRIPL